MKHTKINLETFFILPEILVQPNFQKTWINLYTINLKSVKRSVLVILQTFEKNLYRRLSFFPGLFLLQMSSGVTPGQPLLLLIRSQGPPPSPLNQIIHLQLFWCKLSICNKTVAIMQDFFQSEIFYLQNLTYSRSVTHYPFTINLRQEDVYF